MTAFTAQTVERDSLFTRADFRSKLALLLTVTVVAFLWESPLLLALLALALALLALRAGVRPRYFRLVLGLMLPVYLTLLLTQGFFADALLEARTGRAALTPLLTLPEAWWLVGGEALTLEGLLYGLAIVFKTLALAFVLPLVIFTTDPNTMVVSLVRLGVPYKLAFIFSATLRFFPLLFAEAQAIIEAQRLRGLAVEELGLLRRARVYARIAVPLILGTLVRSQTLDLVLQAKAFSGSPRRSYLHESRLGREDGLLLALSTLFLLGALVGYFGFGVGRFLWGL